MDRLAPASLDWALRHIARFGDTDLLPVPLELQAVQHAWTWLRDELAAVDLTHYSVHAVQRVLVPKPRGGFRVVTQLDPIDALVYTAMVYEVAEALERVRVPADRNIACSYRVELDVNGAFFRPDNGWPAFHAHSRALAVASPTGRIVVADISDFYNQIYHHRLENALDVPGVSEARRRALPSFISQLTATQSRGIPVGPYASIVLAEACLNDVDGYLLRKGAPFTRYVDDFRIFCDSSRSAVRALHDLTDYLNTSQRLSLEPGKTRIRDVQSFLKFELRDPEEEEEASKKVTLESTLAELAIAAGYGITTQDVQLDAGKLNEVTRRNLRELFRDCVTTKPLHLGLARHLLRRAAQIRTSAILPLVMANLDVLAPVLRDTVLYLKVAIPRKKATEYGAEVLRHLSASTFADIPFVRLWLLELVRLRPDLVSAPDALKAAEESQTLVGARMLALLAREYRQADWVRAQKETWRNNRDWDRRAILCAAAVLPSDERRHWLELVQQTSSGLDRAVAQWAAG